MAQLIKLYCLLATVYIASVSSKDLKKLDQVNPVYSLDEFPAIQKTEHLGNQNRDEIQDNRLLGKVRDKIPHDRPYTKETNITQGDKKSEESKPVKSLGEPSLDTIYPKLDKRSDPTLQILKNKSTNNKKSSCSDKSITPHSTSKTTIMEEAKKFTYLAGAAYCSHATLNEWSCTHCVNAGNYILMKILEVEKLNLQAIILLNQKDKELVISIRGSRGGKQAKELISKEKIPYKPNNSVKVQIKFQERADAIFNEIANYLNSKINRFECYRKVIVGHSLGGAIAQLIAPRFHYTFNVPYSDIAVYTYGQPRVGDEKFVKWYNGLKIYTIRVVNCRDPVLYTPMKVFGFYHTDQELYLGNDDSLNDTSSSDDDSCSNNFAFSMSPAKAHKKVWNINLGKKFC